MNSSADYMEGGKKFSHPVQMMLQAESKIMR